MKKQILPHNYHIMILTILSMYGFIGYVSIVGTGAYYVIPLLIFCSVLILNKKIYLQENTLVAIQGFKKIKFELNEVEALSIVSHRPKFSNVSAPAIRVHLNDGRCQLFYYKNYSVRALSEIIEYMITVNRNIQICKNIKSMLRNEESEFDIEKRKENKTATIITLVLILAYLAYRFCKL